MTLFRLKLGLVTAVAAASLLGGAGLADAAAATVPNGGHGAQRDVGPPADGVHPDATVVAPDGTRINGTTASPFAIHPNTREGNLGAQSLALQWIEAHAIANGARIRSTPINGTVVAVMPYGDVVWTSCRRFARDGWWWAWVAYNDWGNHWVSGWTRGDLVRMVRPYTLPSC